MKLLVGRIGRAHGVRGEVAVDVRTDEPELRFAAGAVLQTDPPDAGPLTVAAARRHAGRFVVRFREAKGRAAAEALRGTQLLVDSAAVAASGDPDTFHDAQLLGLDVVTVSGQALGVVTDIRHHAQDLLVVAGDGGEVLVPFVRALVPRVDLESGRLVVDPPDGLLEL